MSNFLEDLKKYLNETPENIVQEQWEKYAHLDEIGVTVDQYLEHNKKYYHITSVSPDLTINELNNNFDPKYSSGFLFVQKYYSYAKCSIFNY